MPFYLVERFVPSGPDLTEAVRRLVALSDEPEPAGRRVRLLLSARVPADETWFGWFEAPDAASVADLSRRAAFPVDRISAAEMVQPVPDPSRAREDTP